MARLIEFYRPQGFIPVSPTFRPERKGKLIVFRAFRPKKPTRKRLILPL